jgi:PKD repeat protein
MAILTCLLFNYAHATHIVGGELTYRRANGDVYEIKLKLYVDCAFGDPAAVASDEFANLGVFDADTGYLIRSVSQSVRRNAPVRVSKTNYNCIKISPNACVDAYEYVTTMILPPRKSGYIISFQRCCRNNTILNLVNPLSTGENIWTRINDTTGFGVNSSPEFRNLPPNFLCTNAPLIFDHSAVDPDGDSLVYEFFHPYTGANQFDPRPDVTMYENPPFSQVVFASGYGFPNAIPSIPTVSLNSRTGLLKIVPSLQGQFVVGIVVKEYRKGKLVGFTQRDFQFNVQNCVFETTSAFTSPNVNCNREVFFTNNSQNADAYFWDFGDSSTLTDTAITQNGYYRYAEPGTYNVKLVARKGNCIDSIRKTVTVFDRIHFKLPPDSLICRDGDLLIRPDTFYHKAIYLWNNNSTDSFIRVSAAGSYWLNVKLGNCNSYDTMFIRMDQSEVKLISDSLVCNRETFDLQAKLSVSGDFKTIDWYSDPDVTGSNYHDSFLNVHKSGMFIVRGLNKENCPYTDTLDLKDEDHSRLFKNANVFTPNEDGINEVFPEYRPAYTYQLTIFDRWGIKVHEEKNIPWHAAGFPSGTYYYFLKLEGCDAKNELHGVVHVIR